MRNARTIRNRFKLSRSSGGSRPCNCTIPKPSRSAISATSKAGRSTNTPTGTAGCGSSATISAATPGATQRGDGGWKFKPIQSAPSWARATASSTLVRPQVLTRTAEGDRGGVSRQAAQSRGGHVGRARGRGGRTSAWPGSRHDQLVQRRLELGLRVDADEAVDLFPLVEDQHGGNGRDPQAARGLRVLVGIQLTDPDLPLILARQLFDRWGEHPARSAPRCPEVDHNGDRRIQDLRSPVVVGELPHTAGHIGCLFVVPRKSKNSQKLRSNARGGRRLAGDLR